MTEPPSIELETRYRPRIEAELAELDALSAAGGDDRRPVELDQQSIGRVSRIDSLQVQAMAQAADRRRAARRTALRGALARLEGGEFGWCGECGEFIGEKRLDIDPAAVRCVDCAAG
jgi:DnaK suppressor protein